MTSFGTTVKTPEQSKMLSSSNLPTRIGSGRAQHRVECERSTRRRCHGSQSYSCHTGSPRRSRNVNFFSVTIGGSTNSVQVFPLYRVLLVNHRYISVHGRRDVEGVLVRHGNFFLRADTEFIGAPVRGVFLSPDTNYVAGPRLVVQRRGDDHIV